MLIRVGWRQAISVHGTRAPQSQRSQYTKHFIHTYSSNTIILYPEAVHTCQGSRQAHFVILTAPPLNLANTTTVVCNSATTDTFYFVLRISSIVRELVPSLSLTKGGGWGAWDLRQLHAPIKIGYSCQNNTSEYENLHPHQQSSYTSPSGTSNTVCCTTAHNK